MFKGGRRQLVRNCEIMNAHTSVLNKERVIIIVIIIIIMLEPAETHLEFYSFLDNFSAFGNQVPRAIQKL